MNRHLANRHLTNCHIMSRHLTNRPVPVRHVGRITVLGLVVAMTLGACQSRRAGDITASIPDDVRDRHPIVLSEAPRSIEIYPGPGRLDPRQSEDIAMFAAEYRSHGRSHMVAEVPDHGGHGGGGGLMAVRDALSRNGISPSSVSVRSYPAGHYSVASPIRLSFAKLQARVPSACGSRWEDLGTSQPVHGTSNKPYWNLGCAYQTNIAAQTADPLDLIRARPEGPLDTTRRMNAIDKLRKGEDPSTRYRDSATQINRNVGN